MVSCGHYIKGNMWFLSGNGKGIFDWTKNFAGAIMRSGEQRQRRPAGIYLSGTVMTVNAN
jgi:hypothetical protein